MGSPKVSVIIPCYNHGRYVEEAVNSVREQTWQNTEILIVNDGSDDPLTVKVLDQISQPKTQVLHHGANQGLPTARNTGIQQAAGEYICCLDADDKLHPTYLEKALITFAGNHGLDIVYSWTQVFGEEDRVWYNPAFDPALLIQKNIIFTAAVFRRSDWKKVGGFRESMTEGYEDWEFWIRMARQGLRGYRIPEKLLFVRRVGRSFIHRAMDRHEQLVSDIQRHNPDVYQNTSWIEEVKASYADQIPEQPFEKIRDPEHYLSLDQAKLFIINEDVDQIDDLEHQVMEESENGPGELFLVSLVPLSESQLDRLSSHTPYLYALPHYLDRHQWKSYLSLLRLRGIR